MGKTQCVIALSLSDKKMPPQILGEQFKRPYVWDLSRFFVFFDLMGTRMVQIRIAKSV